jgi:hypothetical protein
MSLRTVADETPSACRSTSAFEPTGSSGGHVVLDDGAQHVELAIVEHSDLLPRWHSLWPSAKSTPIDDAGRVHAADPGQTPGTCNDERP